ncbi:MAG: hypothetical protein JWQ90_3628 [Hydrocarboniphaga sp.]|uniref:EexN family lipoprotein n=1 Tax=Hydrocarboniphaga sp. TaxID=2033016 RepID=UPI0026336240|nr:EexN family lipoprotein [Hydrocarboniphaga sp.]MDB5971178.1 hypothetical protein [Hydrocarboniphaga sp.]
MKPFPIVIASVLLLSACGKSSAPPAATDSVESLAADPARLKEVQRRCKENRAQVGEATCIAASEATRKRFMGDAKAKYTPKD